MKSTVALLAVAAAVATGNAAASGPPSTSVTCVAGGTTSFAHPPKGTDSVLFVYSAPTGGMVAFFTWTGKAKRDSTPVEVSAGDSVLASFYNGQQQIDADSATCS